MIVLLSFFWILDKLFKQKKIIFNVDFFNVLIFFIVVSFISLLFNIFDLKLSLVEFIISFSYLLRWVFYAMIFFITIDIFNDTKKILQLIKFLLYINLILVLCGFLQLIFYPDFTYMAIKYGWDPHKDRLLSTFFDPNYLAGFFALNCGLILAFLIDGNNDFNDKKILYKYISKFFLFFTFLITFVALVLTLSRSGLLAFFIVSFIIFWFRSKILIFIGLIIIILIIFNSEKVQDRIIGAFSMDTTSIYRVQSWLNAIDIGMQKPFFGYGYNTIRYLDEDINVLSTSSKNASSGSDSSLLNIFIMTGFLGVFLYISLHLVILRRAYLSLLYSKSYIESSLGLFIVSMIISLFVYSWFLNSLLYPYILIFFWVVIGLFYSIVYKKTM